MVIKIKILRNLDLRSNTDQDTRSSLEYKLGWDFSALLDFFSLGIRAARIFFCGSLGLQEFFFCACAFFEKVPKAFQYCY